MAKQKQLVCQHLENISREILMKYKDIIREYVRRRHGVYALYNKNRLYYVGLASNLRSRLSSHLRDRHANTWDRFSVYLTVGDDHLRELESLVLRIASPSGNKQIGKFSNSENLGNGLKRQLSQFQRVELNRMFRDTTAKKAEKPRTRIKSKGRLPALAPYVKERFRIRFDYKGKRHIARVRSDGTINYRGKIYTSPSKVGNAIAKHGTNGWRAWKFQRAPGDWVYLDELRH